MQYTFKYLILFTVISNGAAAFIRNETLVHSLRQRRAISCSRPDVYKCNSGDCIEATQECDGIADCTDGSDETTDCRQLECLDMFFKCAYGACVSGSARCNNEQDCADNSDEKFCNVKCLDSEFTCKIGQCISSLAVCDGHEDCADGSDETLEECRDITCADLNFKCNYGACLEGRVKCNGTTECADGSDESISTCGSTTPKTDPIIIRTSGHECVLPPFPAYGYYKIFGQDTNPIPGLFIGQFTTLKYYCMTGYKLQGDELVPCQDKIWNNNKPLPTCIITCPERISSTLDIKCYHDNIPINCNERVPNGTIAMFDCKDSYEIFQAPYKTIICQDGLWNDNLLTCQPVCGTQSKGVTLIVESQEANVGQYPWHVGIYKKYHSNYDYVCGGSIISPRLILTAAHCFPDKNLNHLYLIAAGKYYSKWNDQRDTYPQYSNVTNIFTPDRYVGIKNGFAADIAIVVLKSPFTMSNIVQPVCLDYDRFTDVSTYQSGQVPGWGLTTESGSTSEELRFIFSPIIGFEQCLNTVPEDFQTFITLDKFCAGYTNGTSVCEGDSGGGYITMKNVNNKNRFYIRGIVSSAPQKEDSCDSRQYSTFTNISEHITWIDRIKSQFNYHSYLP